MVYVRAICEIIKCINWCCAPETTNEDRCGAVVAFERLRDHVANFCEDPYFVARRRMIRKYRAIRKYGRPWAATPDSDDGESGGDSEY